MRFLFVLDSVEAPTAPNPRFGRRLAASLVALGHSVTALELWDGETMPPAAKGVAQVAVAFPGVRQMNRALENGSKQGSPLPLRALRLAAHPAAMNAALHQFVLNKPLRTTRAKAEIERLDAEKHFDCIVAVCAPYRIAFALEAAQTNAKKILWQLDPYAANRDYNAPGGFAREAALLRQMDAVFVTPTAIDSYHSGPLAEFQDKIHLLGFPCLLPAAANPPKGDDEATNRCVYCGSLYPNLRTPDFALDLFSALHNPAWRLVMVGGGWQHFTAAAAKAEAAMQGRLQIIGPVPPEQARAYQGGADLLLSIGNAVDNQLPSKLFEYFGTGKPILHLAATPNDPTLPYLTRYPLALVLHSAEGATPEAAAKLQAWLTEVAGQQLPYPQVAALYPEFTPEAVAQDFLAVAGAL